MKKPTVRATKKSETSNTSTTESVTEKHDAPQRLSKDDLKALRTNIKGGYTRIPRRCCEYTY